MKPKKFTWMLMCILLTHIQLSAQDKLDIKFGKISPKDFSPHSSAIDSGAQAVVLADIGSSEFEGNTKGYFTLIYKKHERILLKNINAFDEATVKVNLYNGSYEYEERFEDFEAITYNLENGQIKETKIDKSALFKEKYNRDYMVMKFTLPNIKEGSIIEYRYTVKSPFYNTNIRSWSFQRHYPVLWSEYKVTIPPIFNYSILRQGNLKYDVDTGGRFFKNYAITDNGGMGVSRMLTLSGDAKWERWVMKDVPAFKNEKYLSSSTNYIPRINFQLRSVQYSETNTVNYVKDWSTVVKELLKDPDFGEDLAEKNSWLDDELAKVTNNTQGLEKAKRIFEYVRDNFTCTDDDARYLSEPLKKTFQAKKGNVVDINLLLTAMLNNRGFDAHPVLLSTRENGKAMINSAILNQYNYVISRVQIDGSYYLLDGSVSKLGFGKLPKNCYNGAGRLINDPPFLIPLSADSLPEEKNSMVFIINDENGGITGSFTSNLGYYESMDVRNKLAKTKTEDFLKEIAKDYSSDVEVSNLAIDSEKRYDQPIAIRYDLKSKFNEDIIYFNPLFSEAFKNNPFTAAERIYPVEMPYRMNETFVLNMEVPKGYKIDELPKSMRLNLNDNEGMFEYLVAGGENIQLRCRLILNKANFTPEDYQTLRDFFAYVVKKESEQIVFKKIK